MFADELGMVMVACRVDCVFDRGVNWRVGKTPRPQSLDKRELALQRRPTGETAFTSNLEVLMAQASQGKAR